MKVTHLKLRNFCCHKDVDADLVGNLIGVIGPNGCGKSTVLNAIRFALTADIPGLTREQMIPWGDDDPDGFVEITLIDRGMTYVIHRGLTSRDVWMTADGEKTKGARNVTGLIEDTFGTNRDIAKYVWVQQAELNAVLFDAPAERERAMHRLCGLGAAEEVYQHLHGYIQRVQLPDETMQAQLDLLRDQAAPLRAAYDELQADAAQRALDSEKLYPGGDAFVAALNAKRSAAITRRSDITRRDGLLADITRGDAAYDKLLTQLAPLEAAQADMTVEQLRTTVTGDRQLVVNIEAAIDSAFKLAAAEVELERLVEPTVEWDTDTTLARVAELTKLINGAQGTVKFYQNLAKALNAMPADAATCPVCDHGVPDRQTLSNRLTEKANAAHVPALVVELNELQTLIATYNANVHNWQTNQARWAGQVIALKATAEAAAAAAPGATPEALETARNTLAGTSALLTEWEARGAEIAEFSTRLQSVAEALVKLRAELELLVVENRDATDTVESVDAELLELNQQIDQAGAMFQVVVDAKAAAVRAKAALDNNREAAADLEARLKKGSVQRQRLDKLEAARDWIYFRGPGPSRLVGKIVDAICAETNQFLSHFTAPFRAVSSGLSLNLQVVFTDGRPMPPEGVDPTQLSGGQRVMLAIAFRLAVYCMFGNRLGMLSLDEPTAYLDEENIELFGTVLDTLSTVADTLDLQILLSTHEASCLDHLDSVVHIPDLKEP